MGQYKRGRVFLFGVLVIFFFSGVVFAEARDFLKDSFASRPVVMIAGLLLLSLLPFFLVMLTSFVKIAVVLSILRSALGTPQIPPTIVITGLALILTVHIMSPVGKKVYDRIQPIVKERIKADFLSSKTLDKVFETILKAKEPIREFLLKHATEKNRALFLDIAQSSRKEKIKDNDFLVVVPAFVISELSSAFLIGFVLFVPFLIIDMVVSNILLALGMHMLSPTTISLPFKLLLFVLVDGWHLITKGLMTSYL
jgi:type III secretion protein R